MSEKLNVGGDHRMKEEAKGNPLGRKLSKKGTSKEKNYFLQAGFTF